MTQLERKTKMAQELLKQQDERFSEHEKTQADNPTDTILNQVEVKEAKTITVEKKTVTAKTLKSWLTQTQRIIKDGLVDKEDLENLVKICEAVKNNWLTDNL